MEWKDLPIESEKFMHFMTKSVDHEPNNIYHNTVFRKNDESTYKDCVIDEDLFWYMETRGFIVKCSIVEEPDGLLEIYRLPHQAYSRGRKSIPQIVKAKVFARCDFKCVYCSSEDNLQIDHIIPITKGGGDEIENLQILCKTCNVKKSNKL